MEVDKINLYDIALEHMYNDEGDFSATCGQTPSHFRYTIQQPDWDGITIVTDRMLTDPKALKAKSKYKIGWLYETREVNERWYLQFPLYKDHYDFILTHDVPLLTAFPNKTRKVLFGGTWIQKENIKIYEKSKRLSMIYSDKTFMAGHTIRHNVADMYGTHMDLFGTGCDNPIDKKEEGLKDYMYSVVVENSHTANYFTEKLIDCFATGTIPIYYGCPNLPEFFDMNGIITFNSFNELGGILPTLTPNLYESKMESVRNNLEKCKEYICSEDWLYRNVFKELL